MIYAPYFSPQELACRCGCGIGEADMRPRFMARLIALRKHLGFPLNVTSAARCPAHNRAVSSTGPYGPHTTFRAVDIRVSGAHALAVVSEAPRFGFTGVGVAQKGPHGTRILHLDDLEPPQFPRPGLWSY